MYSLHIHKKDNPKKWRIVKSESDIPADYVIYNYSKILGKRIYDNKKIQKGEYGYFKYYDGKQEYIEYPDFDNIIFDSNIEDCYQGCLNKCIYKWRDVL